MRQSVLGLPLDAVTLEQAVDIVDGWVRGDGSHYIVTPNPEIYFQAQRPGVRDALAGADLSVADGVGMVWAAARLGEPVPGRVAGADLVEALLAAGDKAHYRFFFLGAKPGVAAAAAQRCAERHPGIVVAGAHDGYFKPEQEPSVAAAIRAARADILLVGLGAPKQELWLKRWASEAGAKAAIGCGGVIDVLAGVKVRPPAWVQRIGLEWLHYLVRQPSRIGRFMALPRFVLVVLSAARSNRKH